ncbi:MAG: biopolymer transporter ExbD [Phycisphaeraceae bacterium]|nr:biopolymer transporter ExbD [Phycisphaeraceae bacterium]
MSEAARRRRGGGYARRDALHKWSTHFGPNMTPMVDIVMVILIFFMASAAFVGEEWFLRAAIPVEGGPGKSNAPKDPLELPPTRINIVMDIDDQGETVVSCELGLDRRPVQELVDRIAAIGPGADPDKIEVMIRPTPRVPYRDVIRVHESCEAANITKVGIGVAREARPAAGSATPPAP